MNRLNLNQIEATIIRLAARAFFGLDGAVYSERNVAKMTAAELRTRIDNVPAEYAARVRDLLHRADLVLREYNDACDAYEAAA